jgi:hypothetical protein
MKALLQRKKREFPMREKRSKKETEFDRKSRSRGSIEYGRIFSGFRRADFRESEGFQGYEAAFRIGNSEISKNIFS